MAETNNNSAVQVPDQLKASLNENLVTIQGKCDRSSDLNVRQVEIGNLQVALLITEGMVNLQTLSEMIIEPLLSLPREGEMTPEKLYRQIEEHTILAADLKDFYSFDELFNFIMSGFAVILIDGLAVGIALGAQGFSFRSISEPSSEVNEMGSREGFTEPLRINMTMIRRRIKNPQLKFELFKMGTLSKTDVALVYLTNTVSQSLLRQLRRQLQNTQLEAILTSGYLRPFLEGKHSSLFSDVGHTERPDTLCAKIQEGRVGILIDGTPFCLIVPYLFSENFQSVDDYAHKPYYASFVRILKYVSFLIAIFLPGTYVAVGTYHPELFPDSLLFNIVSAQETTPFPLVLEALVIHFIYEIMREAGLRLPRPVGHAVSIVGALVIGDAAVTAGLIGSPMVLVVALTAIASFVVPSLQEPMSFLRFAFIIVGGMWGLYGIALASAMVLTNACALTAFGVPYLTPIAPFDLHAMRDTFIRASFRILQRRTAKIQRLTGVHMSQEEPEHEN
ncbi:MAG: spore germination protein [Massiliimalia sp.]